MERKFLDTGILLHYARGSALYTKIEQEEELQSGNAVLFTSVVNIAEIRSLALQSGWGERKLNLVMNQIQRMLVTDIVAADQLLLKAYVEIDCWSKNKLPGRQRGASNPMGKNDLWIAATTHVLNATLLTLDGDFDHLHDEFIQVKRYKP